MSAILTLNAGSSSIKFAVYRDDEPPAQVAVGQVENIGGEARLLVKGGAVQGIGSADHEGAVRAILTAIAPVLDGREVAGVGHRIVHGGPNFGDPMELDAATMAVLEKLIPLAPLHQPHNLAAVRAAQAAFPKAVQVGCFDTGFHRGHPWVNDTFALPRHYYEEGLRRYGFHGISYDYITGALRRDHPELAKGRVIIAHLGNGASMCATLDGRSITSTMGFSALDGLAMGTRCGQIDPGAILYLLDHGMTGPELTRLLYNDSGLRGLSGISHDMRTLLASDDPQAAQAVKYYTHRIRREIGALAAVLGGLDALVFCGGVGENAPRIRAQSVEGLGFLGLTLDAKANAAGETRIGTGPAEILVIRTDEEQVIARAVSRAMS